MEGRVRVIFKPGLVALAAQTAEEEEALAAWQAASQGHVFHFESGSARGGVFLDLGERAQACREPINILFDQGEAAWRPISNLALTPFRLDGRDYASVEGFWQGLKLADPAERAKVARLWGVEAKSAVRGRGPDSFDYDGRLLACGGPGHRELMARACLAKFTQNSEAREALLSTGKRPLTHRARRDSKTIPGALMADIWMQIRARLGREEGSGATG
jgi:predicted NAD-dependent protein-ADP-ribosyltransferase YbiA (DUF1768 family)